MSPHTMLPVEINEGRIEENCVNVTYPIIRGLRNREVQQEINQLILGTVESMLPGNIQCENEADSVTGTYRIRLNQEGLLSLTLFVQWFFFPMAHPAEDFRALTLNVDTGEVYSFSDLFRKGSHYQILINRIIEAEIERRGIVTFAPFPGVSDDQEYYLTPNELVVFFPEYEFTPRPEGFPEFPIPYVIIRNRIDPDGPLARLV